MSENQANFSEVLEIKADLQSFVSSLQALQSEYQSFLGRLSKMAAGTPLSGNSSQAKEQAKAEQELQRTRERSFKALAQYQSLSAEKQRQIAGEVSQTANFWDAVTRNMGGALGVATKYGLAVSAVLEALHLAREAVAGIFREFQTGLAHVREVDRESEVLQGAILGSVKLAADLKDNFSLSAQAAREVYAELEKRAVRDQLQTETLQRGFQAFQGAGGASLTKGTLQESVDIVEQLALAMKAFGIPEQQISRLFATELPQALEGNIKSAGRLAHALGIDADTWNQMVVRARTHHDLLEAITQRLQQYVQIAKEAPANLSKAEEQLALLHKEWDELLVAPALPVLLETIKRISDFFENTKAQTSAFAGSLYSAAQSLGSFLSTLANVSVGANGLKAIFQFLVFAVAAIGEGLSTVVRVLSAVVDTLGRTILTIADVDTWKHPQRAIEQLGASVKKNFVEVADKAKESWARLGTIANGGPVPTGNNLLTQSPVAPPKSPLPNSAEAKDALKALKEHYSEQLQIVREGLQEQENALQEAHARNELSQRDFSERMISLLVQARSRVDQLTAQFVQNISGMSGLTPQQKQAVLSNLTRQQSKEDTRIAQDISKQKQAIAKDEEDRAMAAMKRELDARKQYAAAEISLARTIGATDSAIVGMEVKAREDAYAREKVLLENQLIQAKQNQAQQERILGALALLDQQHYQQSIEDSARRRQAEYSDYQTQLQYEQQLATISEQSEEERIRHAGATSGTPYAQQNAEKAILQLRLQLAEATERLAEKELERAKTLGQQLDIQRAQLNLANAQANTEAVRNTQVENPNTFNYRMFGSNAPFSVSDDEKKLGLTTFSKSVQSAGKAFKQVASVVSAMSQAIHDQNIAAAIGIGLQAAGAAIGGPVGAAMQVGGEILQMISGLFTRAARKIGEQIRNEVQQIIGGYQTGQASLADTMQHLEQERNDAISRLSGKKGGNKELTQILAQINQAMVQLASERQKILKSFDTEYWQLKELAGGHTSEITELISTTRDAITKVSDYLGAGGSVQKAREYLQWSIEKQKQEAADKFRDAEDAAIQDAQQLNSLLEQRVQLADDYKKSEYELLAKDSLERRTANAVSIGRQIEDLTKKYRSSLADLTSQIDLQQQKVDLEKQVFNIQLDSASLQAKAAANAIAALKEQIAGYKDLAAIMRGVYDTYWTNASLSKQLALPGGSGGTYNNSNVTISPGAVVVNVSGPVNATSVGQQISAELARQMRLGWRPSYAR